MICTTFRFQNSYVFPYPGYEWKIVGDNLVLIALSTAVVTAIINGVFD
ncbi:inner membrane protein [Salmonella enterica subsp. enterica serovar Typhi]|nr:inner membrane protein [Salmonella enterica subsp. enterica serovar Typhi]